MSSHVYPGPSVLPGITWNRVRSYLWSTEVQTAVSGKETRISYAQYPRIRFRLTYEFLRDMAAYQEVKRLAGLFNALRGRFDTCLFVDPDFNAVISEQFATGDGTTTVFQLTATYKASGGPGAPEIIQNLNGTPALYNNGSLVSGGAYTLSPTGRVTFGTAPANGNPLTWTGGFHYRVRFEDDQLELSQFMQHLWASKEVALISVKL
jgi:uncharacterized protein (TIGR02217 family)